MSLMFRGPTWSGLYAVLCFMADPLESIWPHDLGRNSERNASGCPYGDTTTLGFWPHGWSQELESFPPVLGGCVDNTSLTDRWTKPSTRRRKWGVVVDRNLLWLLLRFLVAIVTKSSLCSHAFCNRFRGSQRFGEPPGKLAVLSALALPRRPSN